MTKRIEIGDLAPNDLDGALAFVEQELRAKGRLSREAGQSVIMLQDDPAELIRRAKDLERRLGIPEDEP